ncbi:hypothetical protein H6F43_18940 [Leptolyngbya sp. FACHB-36]|uniref:hypothetical protein n=1 Tax=Leptolyngbya sp. FACHB-36 TaxID=2692808 RepID=UPI001680FEBA|nr:hypothetical protein [Leptolyngbya sp. FACHB-36]MBD2022261.1 hypothetical protein [Leptolyngbya sp. FACHB-36]
MKTIEHTSTSLKLKQPVWHGWAFGFVFAAAGALAIVLFAKLDVLSCSRAPLTDSLCHLKRSSVLGSTTQTIPLSTLQGAEIETTSSSDGGSTYRVVLLTPQGTVPFTDYFSSGYSSKEAKATQIQTFAKSFEPSLLIEEDGRWLAFPFGALFIGVGSAIALFLGRTHAFSFDRHQNTLTVQRGRCQDHYSLNDIAAVEVEESSDSDGSTYRVRLVLASGEHIPLSRYLSSGRESKEKLAATIQAFLATP